MQELGADVSTIGDYHEQHWAIVEYIGDAGKSTRQYDCNVYAAPHDTYGGDSGLVAPVFRGFGYDFTSHKTTDDYAIIQETVKVTVIATDPIWIGEWTNSTQAVFSHGFRKKGDTITVKARIRRYSSTAADPYTRIRLVLCDETGAHSTSETILLSAVGTSWQDLTISGVDCTAYNTEMEWALEVVTDADEPASSVNAAGTLHVHHIAVTQV